ncbi:MAG TPA: Hsp20/alpha crystallin family protein [Armatimonadota bacterium]|nr:Hsp20/alpha crystallin family protein [Armatimonadota bacterium]
MQRNNQNLPAQRQQNLARPDVNTPESQAFTSPWQLMRRMQDDMDRLFEGFFTGSTGQLDFPRPFNTTWQPKMDISQTDNEWHVDVDLPGVKPEDVSVETRDHYLTVRAEMREESGDQDRERRYHHRERQYGFFERVLPLPENVNEEQISCDFKDGVLTLRLPKTANAVSGTRRIPIGQGQAQTQAPSALRESQGDGKNQQKAGQEMAAAGANGSGSKK